MHLVNLLGKNLHVTIPGEVEMQEFPSIGLVARVWGEELYRSSTTPYELAYVSKPEPVVWTRTGTPIDVRQQDWYEDADGLIVTREFAQFQSKGFPFSASFEGKALYFPMAITRDNAYIQCIALATFSRPR